MKKILFFLCAFSLLFAEEKTDSKKNDEQKNEKEVLKQTQHSIILEGKELNYTATCGTFFVKNENKKSKAKIFYTSYHKDDGSKDRPITFVFNGGPGSSSVWLHLGAIGPKRINSWEENQTNLPPYNLVDNQETILDYTDLVFIDPVSTGFSDIVEGEVKDFYGTKEDSKAIGDFIYKYITKFNKWVSPKYIIGESYGTLRAIWVTQYLQDDYNIFLNGISLVSPVLDLAIFSPLLSLSSGLILPSYAATAWYHDLLPFHLQNRNLQEVLSEVENFVCNEYVLALMQGDLLSKEQRENIIFKISEFTGIAKEDIEKCNLKVDLDTFITKLLPRDKDTDMCPIIGAHDGRTRGYKSERFHENPSTDLITGSYGAVINDYIRNELQFIEEIPYFLFNYQSFYDWKWFSEKSDPREMDFSHDIKHIFATNPNIKIQCVCGYYDLVTPYYVNEFAVNHFHLPKIYRDNIQFDCYKAGHMIYINTESRKKMKDDLVKFLFK